MGMNLSIMGVTDDDVRRVVELAEEEGDVELDEALLPELEASRPLWYATRTDKAWDVIVYALTGVSSTAEDGDGSVLGVPEWAEDPWQYGVFSGLASPARTARLARDLTAVSEATIRARLRTVPAGTYGAFWADGTHDDALVGDALDLVAQVRTCADAGLGLWLTLG